MPDHGSEVRKISIPPAVVARHRLILGSLGFFLVLFVALFFYYRHGHVRYQESKHELIQLRTTMSKVHTHMSQLESTLDRVSSFDQKLRMMTHLRDPERQLAMGPLGPYDPNLTDDLGTDSPFDDVMPYLQSDTSPSNPEELLVNVKRLQDQSHQQEKSLVKLTDQLRDQELILAATPATWPLKGYVTSRYGMRISPFTKMRRLHAGIDIAAQPGTPVYAPANGTVLFVGSKPGYGKTLIVDHGYGIVTCYAHNSAILVEKGQKLRRGDPIAKVGNTGRSTGPHLHYEVRLHGRPQNPDLFIFALKFNYLE